jgi:hypothetical protein
LTKGKRQKEKIKKVIEDPGVSIEKGLKKGLDEVGRRYEKGEYFLAELLYAGDIMKSTIETLNPYMKHDKIEQTQAIVLGTVRGDLHDIGKVNVPLEILGKTGKLSDIEFSLVKTHPQVGYDILKTLELPWTICPIILQHHERIDGTGYPLGLLGKDTLVEAKILAIADVIEATASHRPYRAGLGIEKALEEIGFKKLLIERVPSIWSASSLVEHVAHHAPKPCAFEEEEKCIHLRKTETKLSAHTFPFFGQSMKITHDFPINL